MKNTKLHDSRFICDLDELQSGGLRVSDVIVGLPTYNNITDDQIHTIQRSLSFRFNSMAIPPPISPDL
jgi:hypothetical protein